MPSGTRKQARYISLTENNVFISGKKELAVGIFNRSLVHIVKMVDGYIISVAYGVYGNVRLQRKMKKKTCK